MSEDLSKKVNNSIPFENAIADVAARDPKVGRRLV